MSREQEIKEGNIKLFVFKEFPFKELNKIVEAIENLGYEATMLEDRIIIQKTDK